MRPQPLPTSQVLWRPSVTNFGPPSKPIEVVLQAGPRTRGPACRVLYTRASQYKPKGISFQASTRLKYFLTGSVHELVPLPGPMWKPKYLHELLVGISAQSGITICLRAWNACKSMCCSGMIMELLILNRRPEIDSNSLKSRASFGPSRQKNSTTRQVSSA